jgi:predicted GIY-YIG superfamily endonuclease
MRDHRYFAYIMASRSRVLYTGITNNMARRNAEHKEGESDSFTATRLHAPRLVRNFLLAHRSHRPRETTQGLDARQKDRPHRTEQSQMGRPQRRMGKAHRPLRRARPAKAYRRRSTSLGTSTAALN